MLLANMLASFPGAIIGEKIELLILERLGTKATNMHDAYAYALNMHMHENIHACLAFGSQRQLLS